MTDKKEWALRYLHYLNVLEDADKGDMNELAEAEDSLIEEFCKLNKIKPQEKFARRCTQCGNLMNKGFVVEGGEEYYCSDNCLHKKYTKEEWDEMYGDGDTDSCWTEWEDPDEFQYYEDGSEVKE